MKDGRGQSSIICPIDIYIKTIRKNNDAIKRFFSNGVSWSASASSSCVCVGADGVSGTFRLAPYPAFSTAAIISEAEAVPSTFMELVRRLTAHEVTPGSFFTARSTLALQAAQLIPVILYVSDMIFIHCLFMFVVNKLYMRRQDIRAVKRV